MRAYRLCIQNLRTHRCRRETRIYVYCSHLLLKVGTCERVSQWRHSTFVALPRAIKLREIDDVSYTCITQGVARSTSRCPSRPHNTRLLRYFTSFTQQRRIFSEFFPPVLFHRCQKTRTWLFPWFIRLAKSLYSLVHSILWLHQERTNLNTIHMLSSALFSIVTLYN